MTEEVESLINAALTGDTRTRDNLAAEAVRGGYAEEAIVELSKLVGAQCMSVRGLLKAVQEAN